MIEEIDWDAETIIEEGVQTHWEDASRVQLLAALRTMARMLTKATGDVSAYQAKVHNGEPHD